MPRLFFCVLTGLLAMEIAGRPAAVAGRRFEAAQTQGPTERPFTVIAKKYSFTPARIEVYEGDLVRVDLNTVDIDHSFTIDSYRIAKRVTPKHPVTFDFRADRTGSFPIYCDLKIDDGCRQMKGELVVRPRR